MFAAEQARSQGIAVLLDVDFRADQWSDPRAFGVAVRPMLRWVDVALGTEEEIKAAALAEVSVSIEASQISDPRVEGDITVAVETLLQSNADLRALVVKRGSEGASAFLLGGEVLDVPPFPVEVQNFLGAGDAFASGFVHGFIKGWDWYKAARMANACGAIVATRHGCANFMPYEDEALKFIDERGGF